MDRSPHDYAAAAAYSQQQQQQTQPPPFGYHQPPQYHGGGATPPFPPPQFPYHHHHAPNPYAPPPPHLLHLQQAPPPPAFPPHIPPPHFHGTFDAPPPAPAAPPVDPELQKRIDKLVEYSAKNGPEFEAMIREKQQDNPEYGFLFGGDGHGYYRYKLWLSTRLPSFLPPPQQPSMHLMHTPVMHQSPYFYEQQQQQHSQFYARPEYEQSPKPFKGLSGPLPTDVAAELNNVLVTLNGTKESIKGAKFWFMQRSVFAPALAESLRDRVLALDDSERQLHIIYLANDILFESVQRRKSDELDNEALAFKDVLGSMLARIYHHPQIQEENQSKLQQLLQLWASNNIYDPNTINLLRSEMTAGQSTASFPGLTKDLSAASADAMPGLQLPVPHNLAQWHPDRQSSVSSSRDQEHPDKLAMPGHVTPVPIFAGLIPTPPSVLPTIPQTANSGEKAPPYPLFPPGLIPGMVRKMQIGSGVPYSSMSPLDIPTVIPPSTVSQSEILERVSKFFKEIGEVNPLEGLKSDDGDYDGDYEREPAARMGKACIPPPPNLQVDPETGMYPDGTVEQKTGFGSSGRLGLGAAANPNEISQYDDVYSSYRKQRSTNYHSSMSTRAVAR